LICLSSTFISLLSPIPLVSLLSFLFLFSNLFFLSLFPLFVLILF
jgi:hypothetical protein